MEKDSKMEFKKAQLIAHLKPKDISLIPNLFTDAKTNKNWPQNTIFFIT